MGEGACQCLRSRVCCVGVARALCVCVVCVTWSCAVAAKPPSAEAELIRRVKQQVRNAREACQLSQPGG